MCKEKPEFVTRMEEESKQLNERLEKLNAFIAKENKGCISDEEYELLRCQANAMSNYKYFLNERIKYYHTIFQCK